MFFSIKVNTIAVFKPIFWFCYFAKKWYMLWSIKAIKQGSSWNININFLIQANNENSIRDFLWWYNVIILSLESYDNPIENYWSIYLSIAVWEKNITIISDISDPSEAVNNLVLAGFKVMSVNNKQGTLGPNEVQNILTQAYENQTESISENRKEKEKKITTKEKTYSNEEKNKLDTIVTNTIEDIIIIKQNESEWVSPDLIKELEKLDSELRKVKNSSNISTIVQTLEKVFTLMEKIELEHINQLKKNEIKIFEESQVSNIDVKQELGNFKIAQVVNETGSKKSWSDKYYNFMGISGIYNKFLWKDITAHINSWNKSLNSLLDITKLTIIIVMIVLIWEIFLSKLLWRNYPEQVLMYLIHLGSLAIPLHIIHHYRSEKPLYIIGQIILIILLYFLLTTLLIVNFSLS